MWLVICAFPPPWVSSLVDQKMTAIFLSFWGQHGRNISILLLWFSLLKPGVNCALNFVQKEIKTEQKCKKVSSKVRLRAMSNPDRMWKIRMKFLNQAKSYFGTPYAKKYWTCEGVLMSVLFNDCFIFNNVLIFKLFIIKKLRNSAQTNFCLSN